jgi:hypothetical protein
MIVVFMAFFNEKCHENQQVQQAPRPPVTGAAAWLFFFNLCYAGK